MFLFGWQSHGVQPRQDTVVRIPAAQSLLSLHATSPARDWAPSDFHGLLWNTLRILS